MPDTIFIHRRERRPLSRGQRACFGLLLLGCFGCGGSSKGADDPSSGGTAHGGKAWKDKTHEQRLDWMGLEVFPKMKGAFTEFNGERFAKFRCQTCHGDDMEVVDFKMPNDKIYALPRKDTLQSARDYDAAVTDFMSGTVVPKMAELLDMEPYDPATQSGFGCFNCHPAEGD